MGEYEFRVLNANGTITRVTCEFHLNTPAAIRSARRLAKSEDFEVWFEGERIHPRGGK